MLQNDKEAYYDFQLTTFCQNPDFFLTRLPVRPSNMYDFGVLFTIFHPFYAFTILFFICTIFDNAVFKEFFYFCN